MIAPENLKLSLERPESTASRRARVRVIVQNRHKEGACSFSVYGADAQNIRNLVRNLLRVWIKTRDRKNKSDHSDARK
jgi:hypothetical protein